jgi:hypothetical protein
MDHRAVLEIAEMSEEIVPERVIAKGRGRQA